MKIAFYPISSKQNKYVEILSIGLGKRGYQFADMNDFLKSLGTFFDTKIVHLNWFENIEKATVFYKRLVLLINLLLIGKKIVWTVHNRTPHDGKFPRLSRIMMHLLFRFSSRVVIHSRLTEEVVKEYGEQYLKKAVYIPHPDYIGVYGHEGKNRRPASDDQLRLLFIGAVSPYKNIELLIDTVREIGGGDLHLTIAGRPRDAAYAEQITRRAAGSCSICLDLRFLDDSDLVRLIGESDILVLPYSQRSSLNSGTVILAFSYGKTVICPAIGTVLDYDSTRHMLVYDYHTPEEHVRQLKAALLKAIELFREDPEVFEKWGREVKAMVASKNDKEAVADQFDNLYRSLM